MRISLLLMLMSFGLRAVAESVSALHLSSYADTEATTNVVFNAGAPEDRLFRLSIELDAATNNNVTVAFGTDSNANGMLEREEIDALVGWDSGSWFYRDRVTGVEATVARTEGHRRLDWALTLNPRKAAKSVMATDADGVVFTGVIPAVMFDSDWDLMQVTARGLTEPSGVVVNEVSGWGFNVIVR